MKACTKCKSEQPFDNFCKNRTQKSGYDSWCKACKTDHRLRKAYGISSADYDRMVSEQGGVCKICKRLPRRSRFDIDHCHVTGDVRGLLCEACNIGLGCFGDNVALLENSINYLNGHSKRANVQPNSPEGQ